MLYRECYSCSMYLYHECVSGALCYIASIIVISATYIIHLCLLAACRGRQVTGTLTEQDALTPTPMGLFVSASLLDIPLNPINISENVVNPGKNSIARLPRHVVKAALGRPGPYNNRWNRFTFYFRMSIICT